MRPIIVVDIEIVLEDGKRCLLVIGNFSMRGLSSLLYFCHILAIISTIYNKDQETWQTTKR